MPLQPKLDRSQMQIFALDQLVDQDSIVRVIDLFCQCIDYQDLGFTIKGKSNEGKPAYEASTLTSIYIYGYLHKIRSCRLLAKACTVNSELWWLTGMQKPCYKTIANFRKDNSNAFKNLFNSFSKFCLDLELYGKTTIAIDGSKFRALNSKKNNYSLKKINKHLDYIAQQKKDYLNTLDQNDRDDHTLHNIQKREDKYKALKTDLLHSEDSQISTTDPDARALPLKMNIVEVAYNLQSVVDDKHNLILEYQVTNSNDLSALAPLARKAKAKLQLSHKDDLTILADKGYFSGKHIHDCHNNNIDTLVSPKKSNSANKDPRVAKAKFIFDNKKDAYTCPQGQILKRLGKIATPTKGVPYQSYAASFTICKKCPLRNVCLSNTHFKNNRGRIITRSIYQDAVDKNNTDFLARKNEYKRRQAIVEHPFGTIKRQWGFDHVSLKGLKKVNGEFGLICLCYNIRRVLTILGVQGLKMALFPLKSLVLIVCAVTDGLDKYILTNSCLPPLRLT